MGLDRNNKSAQNSCLAYTASELSLKVAFQLWQDPLRIRIRRILPALRSPSFDALHLGDQVGRADNSM